MYPAGGAERPFEVTILEADAQGVAKLAFRFAKPLSDPAYRFYLASPANPAAAIRFRTGGAERFAKWEGEAPAEPGRREASARREPRPPRAPGALAIGHTEGYSVAFAAERLAKGEAGAAQPLLAALQSGTSAEKREAWAALAPPAGGLPTRRDAPVRSLMTDDAPPPADAAAIREWWFRNVDDRTVTELWLRRDQSADLRDTRDALTFIRGIASAVIKTDLYLTGPPYPGPR